jgi:hypothetical protein
MQEKKVGAARFSARFSISWPVHAGGYPRVEEMASVVSKSLGRLKDDLDQRTRSALGPDGAVEHLSVVPSERAVDVILTITAPEGVISDLMGTDHLRSLGAAFGDDLASCIKTFVLVAIPEARRGANAYHVTYALGDRPVRDPDDYGRMLHDRTEAEQLVDALEPAAKALDRVDYNRLKRISQGYRDLYDLAESTSRGDVEVATGHLTPATQLASLNSELGTELDESGLGEAIRRNSELIQRMASLATLPAVDAELMRGRYGTEMLYLAQQENHLSEVRSFRSALTISNNVLKRLGSADEAGVAHSKGLAKAAAIGRIALGGLFAASNITLGALAGAISSLPTLGLGTVAATVGICTSAYTGLNSALGALKELGDALER